MFQPDLEAIRKNAISDMLDNMAFKSSNGKKMAGFLHGQHHRSTNLLAEYNRQLTEYEVR